MTWQQFLTERVLGECWHERANPGNAEQPRCTCGVVNDSAFALNEGHIFKVRRTFDCEADMMALYRAIKKAGKWEDFEKIAKTKHPHGWGIYPDKDTFTSWLICLSGEGYEKRCKMVAEFAGWSSDQEKGKP